MIIECHRLKDKEPEEDNYVLLDGEHSNGGVVYAKYQPPRRGRELGDWGMVHDDGTYEERPAKKNDRWICADFLTDADFLDGKTFYVNQPRD